MRGTGVSLNLEQNDALSGYGEDAAPAIALLLWDLYDSANEEHTRTGAFDRTSMSLARIWNAMQRGSLFNLSDFWNQVFLSQDPTTIVAGNPVSGMEMAVAAAPSFVEFGMAPYLVEPGQSEKLDLDAAMGPTFRWEQRHSSHADLALNHYQLMLFSNDLGTLIFKREVQGDSYSLSATDLAEIRNVLAGAEPASLIAMVAGTARLGTGAAVNPGEPEPETGPYLSNSVELLLQDVNRAVVCRC